MTQKEHAAAEIEKRIKEIQRLKSLGYKRKEIMDKLGINKHQCYYSNSQEVRIKRKKCCAEWKQKAKLDPYYSLRIKVNQFKTKNGLPIKIDYSYEDVMRKFLGKEICYLTGSAINLQDGESYHLDHVIPASKGGSNELDNMQLCSKYANIAKNDLDINSLLKLCEQILSHHASNN